MRTVTTIVYITVDINNVRLLTHKHVQNAMDNEGGFCLADCSGPNGTMVTSSSTPAVVVFPVK